MIEKTLFNAAITLPGTVDIELGCYDESGWKEIVKGNLKSDLVWHVLWKMFE